MMRGTMPCALCSLTLACASGEYISSTPLYAISEACLEVSWENWHNTCNHAIRAVLADTCMHT